MSAMMWEDSKMEEEYWDDLESILQSILSEPHGDGIQAFSRWYEETATGVRGGLELALQGKIEFARILRRIEFRDYAFEVYGEIRDAILDDEDAIKRHISQENRHVFSLAVGEGFRALDNPNPSLSASFYSVRSAGDSASRPPSRDNHATNHHSPRPASEQASIQDDEHDSDVSLTGSLCESHSKAEQHAVKFDQNVSGPVDHDSKRHGQDAHQDNLHSCHRCGSMFTSNDMLYGHLVADQSCLQYPVNQHVATTLKRYRSFASTGTLLQGSKGADFQQPKAPDQPKGRESKDDTEKLTHVKVQLKVSPKTMTDEWFDELKHDTHAFLYGEKEMHKGRLPKDGLPKDKLPKDGQDKKLSYEPIRIAILDSGIANHNRQFQRTLAKHNIKLARFKEWKSFIPGEEPSAALSDESGHGSTVAYQICKTTPTAELYIARVVRKSGNRWEPDEQALAAAIRHAVNDWKVHIINMSLGFDRIDDNLDKAIRYAHDNDVVMFAATTNYGLRKGAKIMFPASHNDVFAVDAADGNGHTGPYHAPTRTNVDKTRLTAPGMDITSPISDELDEGASFATAIASGVAALALEFASQYPLSLSPDVLAYLKKQDAMLQVLKSMSYTQTSDNFLFLTPWKVLANSYDRFGGDGTPGTARYFVGHHHFVEMLRNMYKEPIGQGTYPYPRSKAAT